MCEYILANIQNSMNDITKVLIKQRKTNRRLALLTLVGAAYIYASEKRHRYEISELSKEIEELKQTKGE